MQEVSTHAPWHPGSPFPRELSGHAGARVRSGTCGRRLGVTYLRRGKMAACGLSRQVRSFSTSVVRPFAKLVRPPVQIYGIEGRYATALYSAAVKQNKLDQVEKELLRVGQLLKDPKVSLAVLNPYVKRSIKVKSLSDITAKEKLSPLTANLMNLLAENGRLDNTHGIISAFSTIMSVHRGEVPCMVTTASALNEAVLSELKTVLKSFLGKGQVLNLKVKTDPSIMGGMIVQIGEKYVDMSTKTKIQKLSKAMRDLL
ncbi:ATP synthase subunit O, mitochondrial isoform X2 [Cricetulus griseus]|uniref:ATP synthase peripheral stalk subunit OSCP, mitochondrial n=2 Tax=Cricetulus griseus TaxID=10029 RepID=A0A9J7FYF9_CRIGR|nr:ATP synthase subunit O, mitochondrial isoform X2 [Cricetulus griseus]